MTELEITPDLEAEILIRAHYLGVSPELLRYYVQFGPGAPVPPSAPSKWKRAWWAVLRGC